MHCGVMGKYHQQRARLTTSIAIREIARDAPLVHMLSEYTLLL